MVAAHGEYAPHEDVANKHREEGEDTNEADARRAVESRHGSEELVQPRAKGGVHVPAD